MSWFVYILRCRDNTLYTGITNNVEKRLLAHQEGRGAKYTKGRGPFKIVYKKKFKTRSEATIKELEIKKLNSKEKRELIF
ncbi:MAG: GIY-YIG nuclease family protein [Pseudomonadota bacterium]|nr:GIY-YIG nuclease family protein [Pseudomonadota bacterium]